MQTILLTLAFLFSLSAPGFAADTFHYRMVDKNTGEIRENSRVRFEPSEDTITLFFENGRTSYTQKKEYLLNKNYETLKWHDVDTERSTDYKGERLGNNLRLQGRFHGKPLDKNIKIDDAPFLVVPKYELIALARSQQKKPYTFWAMREDTLEVHKMIATNSGEEVIKVNGQDVKAWKVFWSPANRLLRIFKRTYYYRQPDGMFLKQEYADGAVREMIKEE